ncbi:hypothetical protein BC832DRAFT_298632 [Gaertneriomyces semiglobifer]|nr:hypothetical protein BC832DRAFT_298632 [Gaertneriomyces semiglobifer]
MHITLMTLYLPPSLNSEKDYSTFNSSPTPTDLAIQTLLESANIVQEHFPNGPPALAFTGVDNFDNGRVVFAKPSVTEDFKQVGKLAVRLIEKFTSSGIAVVGNRKTFVPHCTLMVTISYNDPIISFIPCTHP